MEAGPWLAVAIHTTKLLVKANLETYKHLKEAKKASM